MYACVYIYIYTCMHIYIDMVVCIHTYIHIYIYIGHCGIGRGSAGEPPNPE